MIIKNLIFRLWFILLLYSCKNEPIPSPIGLDSKLVLKKEEENILKEKSMKLWDSINNYDVSYQPIKGSISTEFSDEGGESSIKHIVILENEEILVVYFNKDLIRTYYEKR